MTAWLSLAISLVALAVVVVLVRGMVDRRTGSAVALDEIRREVGAILTEMNQATERNIELMEDKIEALTALIDQADRRLTVLRRENSRQGSMEQTYSKLRRSANQLSDPAEAADPPAETGDHGAADGPDAESQSPVEAGSTVEEDSPSVKEQVLTLYRQGLSVDRIATRVGTAVSEVEFIVSLNERR
jgi:TolA-binding protein